MVCKYWWLLVGGKHSKWGWTHLTHATARYNEAHLRQVKIKLRGWLGVNYLGLMWEILGEFVVGAHLCCTSLQGYTLKARVKQPPAINDLGICMGLVRLNSKWKENSSSLVRPWSRAIMFWSSGRWCMCGVVWVEWGWLVCGKKIHQYSQVVNLYDDNQGE